MSDALWTWKRDSLFKKIKNANSRQLEVGVKKENNPFPGIMINVDNIHY